MWRLEGDLQVMVNVKQNDIEDGFVSHKYLAI
jgi:hypothetical protein